MEKLEIEDLIFQTTECRQEALFLVSIKGLVITANPLAASLFGYPDPKELIGLPVTQLVPDDFAKLFPEEIPQEHLTQGEFVPRINRKKDGTLFPTQVKTCYVYAGSQKFVQTTVRLESRQETDQQLIERRCLEQNIALLKCELRKVKNTSLAFQHPSLNEAPMNPVEIDFQFRACLTRKHKNLNTNDLKLASLIFLNQDSHQISEALGISLNGVYVARKRLRKKLNLDRSVKLTEYLIKLVR